jgi:hypothetical protein
MIKTTFAAFTFLLLTFTASASAHVLGGPFASSIHSNAEVGREVEAPPSSAACMTDHGPSECDEPMWVYGSPTRVSRYKSAF